MDTNNILSRIVMHDLGEIKSAATPSKVGENYIPAATFSEMAKDLDFQILNQESFVVEIQDGKSRTTQHNNFPIPELPFSGFTIEKKGNAKDHEIGLKKWEEIAKNHKSDLTRIQQGKKVVATYEFPYFKVVDK